MSTRKERAWQGLNLAKDRFSDAAIIIADNVVFEEQPPTAAELEEYRDAMEDLALAHREYAIAIEKEVALITEELENAGETSRCAKAKEKEDDK